MAGFFNAVSACVVLVLMMSVGYVMGRLGWMSAQEKKFVSRFIVNIAVPCNCVVGLLGNLDHDSLVQAGLWVVSALVGMGVTLLLSMGAAALLRLPRARWGVFVAMAGLSNALFIGIPVCTQLFGEQCMPYVMLYYLGNTSLLQSVGIMLIQYSGGGGERKPGALAFLRDLFSKPPILAVALALTLLALDLELPATLMRFGDYVGRSVTPLALLYCGYVVYELGLKQLRLLPGLPAMLAIRLVVAPAVCACCCWIFGVEGMARDVFLMESALPVVSQVPVLAGAFGADERYAATGACLSILFCLITIPVLMTII